MQKAVLHYDIIEKLGEGGMGTVYLAEDTRLKRKVALKFLPGYISSDESVRERFKNEAQAAAALNHPHISQVYAIEEGEGGGQDLFIVMEYVKGQELKEYIRSHSLTQEEKIRIACQIAEGLNAAHQKGIIHRDIKSTNIMIDEEGNAKIMDFGLARMPGTEHITKEGSTVGTTAYMSPEQLLGEKVDTRTDIWSFGVVLYELFTGELPFQGVHEPAIMYSITGEAPRPVTARDGEVSPEIERIIGQCLEKKTEKRYGELSELIEDLRPHITPKAKKLPAGVSLSRLLTVWAPLGLVAVVLLFLLLRPRATVENYVNSELPEHIRVAVMPFSGDDQLPDASFLKTGLYSSIGDKLKGIEQAVPSFTVIDPDEIRTERDEIRTVRDANSVLNANLVTTVDIRYSPRWLISDRIRFKITSFDGEKYSPRDSVILHIPVNLSLWKVSKKVEEGFLMLLQVADNNSVNEAIRKNETGIANAEELHIRAKAILEEGQEPVNIRKGIHLINQALELDPEYATAYASLGKGYWGMYEHTGHSAYVDSARNALINALSINNQLVSVKEALGTLRQGTGQYEEARDLFREVIEAEPGNADAWRGLAEAYKSLGNTEMVEKTYRRAIEEVPENWEGYLDLGRFYHQHGNNDLAQQYYEKAINLSPDNFRLMSNLGGIYFQRGNIELAMKYWTESVNIRENYAAFNNLGIAYHLFMSRYEQAAEMYEKALKLRPKAYRVRANLASMYEQIAGREQEVVREYETAVEHALEDLSVNPNDVETLANLSNYYAELGKQEESLSYLEKVFKLASGNMSLNLLLTVGYTYEELGNRDKALEWTKQAIAKGYPVSYLKRDPEMNDLVNDPRF